MPFVRKRWKMWVNSFHKFNDEISKRPQVANKLDLDVNLLYQAAQSYHFDMERHKAFHFADDPLKKANDVKQFAYSLYWLMKLRPVITVRTAKARQVSSVSVGRDPTLLANAYFALIVATNHQPGMLQRKLLFELLYAMTYREIGKDGYLMTASMIKHFVENGFEECLLLTDGRGTI
jgi:hypothetical protein